MPEGIYSANRLTNGSFETGSFTDWLISGTLSVVDGGTDGDKCCEMVTAGSFIQQALELPFKPLDIEIQGDFLPAEDGNGQTQIPGYMLVYVVYTNNVWDEITVPVRDDGEASIEWV